MNYREFMRQFAVPLNLKAHRCCLALERRGFRFLVDYGYMNAENLLRAQILKDWNYFEAFQ